MKETQKIKEKYLLAKRIHEKAREREREKNFSCDIASMF